MNYITGKTIRTLREKQKLTQSQLATMINVTDKAISKWENDRGLPDIGIIPDLAKTLGVSVVELLTGEVQINTNRRADLSKSCYYICPLCGNVIFSVGKGSFSCCGITLPVQEADFSGTDRDHKIIIETIENEYYVHLNHPMEKNHFICFITYITQDSVQVKRLYPEMEAEAYFRISGKGKILAYCYRHELYGVEV